MRRKSKFIMILFVCMVAMLAGCGQSKKEPDDYATNNVKSEKTDSAKKTSEGIAKDKIKVGVVHLSDPDVYKRQPLRTSIKKQRSKYRRTK